jgi:hypothetical protein
MWMALIVLIVGLGGGGLYIATRPPAPTPPGPIGTLAATLTAEPTAVEKGHSATLSWSSQNATDLDLEPGVGKVQAEGSTSVTPQDSTTYTLTATGPGGTQSPSAHISVTIPPTPLPPPPGPVPSNKKSTPKKKTPEPKLPEPVRVDPTRIRSAITQGDFFLKRGEYDSAIAAYQEGLNLDPSNQELRDKLDKTKKARDIERKVLRP